VSFTELCCDGKLEVLEVIDLLCSDDEDEVEVVLPQ